MFASAVQRTKSSAASGRLAARPPPPGSISFPSMPSGLQDFKLGTVRNPLVYVPRSYDPRKPTPTIISLHGAGGDAKNGLDHLLNIADAYGTLLVSTSSRSSTWDVIRSSGGALGPDVDHMNATLTEVFSKYNVDPKKLALSGFSDGASYALTLGLPNGDLFSHIIAFSPGFMLPPSYVGKPKIYVSHGVNDQVLSAGSSRSIVSRLQQSGYDVVYHEFNGTHTVPMEIAKEGYEFLLHHG